MITYLNPYHWIYPAEGSNPWICLDTIVEGSFVHNEPEFIPDENPPVSNQITLRRCKPLDEFLRQTFSGYSWGYSVESDIEHEIHFKGVLMRGEEKTVFTATCVYRKYRDFALNFILHEMRVASPL